MLISNTYHLLLWKEICVRCFDLHKILLACFRRGLNIKQEHLRNEKLRMKGNPNAKVDRGKGKQSYVHRFW